MGKYANNPEKLLERLYSIIDYYGLSCSYRGINVPEKMKKIYIKTYYSKYNKEAYLKMRQDYNKNKDNVLLLYLLLIYGFNHMIRFNSKGDFNLPVGNVDFNKNVYIALKNYLNFRKNNEIIFENTDYQKFLNKKANIEKEIQRLKNETVKPTEKVNELLKKYGTTELSTGTKMSELLKRTELDYNKLAPIDENRPELTLQEKEEVEIQIKYEGYIKMQEAQVEKFKKLETKLLPEELDYEQIKGLSLEARQKLNKFKPRSIGQASRISGVSPADISVLLIYLQVNKNN